MKLLTKEIKQKLAKNVGNGNVDKPYLKLFNPTGVGTWLISEYDEETGLMFGLCDLGYPELGYVSLEELESVELPWGLKIERDMHFEPEMTLMDYYEQSRAKGGLYV
jgi:glutamine amidotransferase-like uncharacterized protein